MHIIIMVKPITLVKPIPLVNRWSTLHVPVLLLVETQENHRCGTLALSNVWSTSNQANPHVLGWGYCHALQHCHGFQLVVVVVDY